MGLTASRTALEVPALAGFNDPVASEDTFTLRGGGGEEEGSCMMNFKKKSITRTTN